MTNRILVASLFFLFLSGDLLLAQYNRFDRQPSKNVDERIRILQRLLKSKPEEAELKNRLANEYLKKVRETGDVSYLTSAEKLVVPALDRSPNNYELIVTLAQIRMNQHRFSDTVSLCKRAISLRPDSAVAYGFLGDAEFERGNYKECEKAYGQMSDRSPGPAAYSRQAIYSRFIGKPEEAIQIMQAAFRLSDPGDPETHSWFLVQLGKFAFEIGKLKDARLYYQSALKIFPHSYNGLAGLARVSAAEGDFGGAIALYNRAIAIVPMPEFVAPLGDLYQLQGNSVAAKKQYDLLELIMHIGELNKDLYNRQIALYYADHDLKLAQALEMVQKEFEVRKDIYGYDALAWCLFKSGKTLEASNRILPALQFGTRDPMLYYHAGEIFMKAGREQKALQYFKKALEMNPHFHYKFAKQAQSELQKLQSTPNQKK